MACNGSGVVRPYPCHVNWRAGGLRARLMGGGGGGVTTARCAGNAYEGAVRYHIRSGPRLRRHAPVAECRTRPGVMSSKMAGGGERTAGARQVRVRCSRRGPKPGRQAAGCAHEWVGSPNVARHCAAARPRRPGGKMAKYSVERCSVCVAPQQRPASLSGTSACSRMPSAVCSSPAMCGNARQPAYAQSRTGRTLSVNHLRGERQEGRHGETSA